ncbi:MAG: hypothetical protein ABSA67_08250 [Candidatus Brocadiia bacterium]
MARIASLTADLCPGLTPRMFAVNHSAGEKLSPQVAGLLDPVLPGSFHHWLLARERSTELHYHDFDEYWGWTKGRTQLTIRLPDARQEEFEIGPGWIVYCVRGVEHGHQPLEDWGCFEWQGTARAGARPGHLNRAF